MGSTFLDLVVRRLALCAAFAIWAGCGRDATLQEEGAPEPGAPSDAGGDAPSDEAEADPPRHYQPGVLPSCLSDARVVDETGNDDAPVSDDASIDGPSASDDASIDDASVLDDAGDETTTLAAAVIEPGDPGPADITFTIRADRGVHPISPLIYGTNDGSNFLGNGMGLLRAGGNRWTAFNWETGASNGGKDYRYQNDDNLAHADAPGSAVYATIRTALISHAVPLITVPIVNYVAADKNGGGDVRTTPDYLATRFRENMPTRQAPFSVTPDPNDPYVYEDEFVSWVKATAAGGTVAFSLDNEPDLWNSTHPEVHPNKVTYDELVSRDIDFALAIKNVWPEAKVYGFVSFGWAGFTTLQNAPDAADKGDFVDYYLRKMMEAECHYQKRLVDYLDLHWYSEIRAGRTRITSSVITAPVVEARLQAPRSLWDPNYVEDTYITADMGGLGHVPIALIPRMLEKIRRYYPGTQLSISEWTYGGGSDISGALATADALGSFGKAGLGAAAIWPLNAGPYTWAAFRAFRTFDGKGAQFGDTSIDASTSDGQASSVYASIDSTDPNRVVVVAINKDPAEKSAAIQVAHAASFTSATVYTLTAAGPTLVPAAAVAATASNAFLYTMPARSLSVLVLSP
jgi:Glycoside hydrolase family 44